MMSAKFTQLFSDLPPEAQHTLVEKHLAKLVDLLPKERSKNILLAAAQLERKYKDAPKLDLRAKRKQIDTLLDELARDAKVSFIKERSNREELLAETIHSLVSWVNDIWSAVYEYSAHFVLAHTCLLFIADSLLQLSGRSSLGGCKCAIMNLPIRLELKTKRNKVLKRFSVVGPQNLDRVLLWVWRDLFVSLLSNGTEGDKKKIPLFLQDIETSLGIDSLGRLLYGGKAFDVDEEVGGSHDSDSDAEEIGSDSEESSNTHFSDKDEEVDDFTDDSARQCTCDLHANYWPEHMDQERITLRLHVETHLFSAFEMEPALKLYNTLMTLSENAQEADDRVNSILEKVAGDTANNLVGAIDIRISNKEPGKIISLLDSYSYLLRPRDADTLQCAVAMLNHTQYHTRGLAIMEKELHDCIRATYNTVRSCFAHIEDEGNKKDLQEILKLRGGSPERKARVEAWGERVITSSDGPLNPMAFAAMMMGLPLMPGGDGDDDADILNYIDLDQDDPDLEDLRDEYRPNLKAIFDGWNHLGSTMIGGPTVLGIVYLKTVEIMPWLRSSDLVNEMTNRLRERPSKIHVVEALINLSAFVKLQRKKLSLVKNVTKSRKSSSTNTEQPVSSGSSLSNRTAQSNNNRFGAAAQSPFASFEASASRTPSPHPATPSSAQAPLSVPMYIPFVFGGPSSDQATPPPLTPPTFPPVPGGIEDVD